jgi:flagellar biosynthesis/type III secretory pathway chaperone
LAYAIGYGVGKTSNDIKVVELTDKNIELIRKNTELQQALTETLAKLGQAIRAAPKTTSSYNDNYRLLEIEQEIDKIQAELFNQKLEREGLGYNPK